MAQRAANPFYVKPSGSAASGLQGLATQIGGIVKTRKEFELAKAATAKERELRQEAATVFGGGDLDKMQEFLTKNPKIGAEARAAYDFKTKATEQNAITTAWDIVRGSSGQTESGKPVTQALAERGEFVAAEGGDPSDTIKIGLQESQQPGTARKEAESFLMLMDTKKYKEWREVKGEPVGEAPEIRKEKRAEERLIRTEGRAADRLAAKEIRDATKTATKQEKDAATELGKEQQKQVNVLRKDIFNITKPFRLVEQAYARIEGVGGRATAASDLSLIFNYMKMLDPGSTVREGEFANAQNSAGIPDRITNLWNRALEGTRLAPEQRDQFIDTAKGLMEAQRGATDTAIEGVLQQADQDQIPRERVLGDTAYQKLQARMPQQPVTGNVSEMSDDDLLRAAGMQ
jgi:hypothetical protein